MLHDDVSQRDLLDAPPLALDDHDVIDADRLRNRNLKACEQGRETALRSEADDDAGDAGGRENRRAEMPYRVEDHQHRSEREHADDHGSDLSQHHHLRVNRPRMRIVGHVDPMPDQDEPRHRIDELEQNVRERAHDQDADDVTEELLELSWKRERWRAENDGQQRQDDAHGTADHRRDQIRPIDCRCAPPLRPGGPRCRDPRATTTTTVR